MIYTKGPKTSSYQRSLNTFVSPFHGRYRHSLSRRRPTGADPRRPRAFARASLSLSHPCLPVKDLRSLLSSFHARRRYFKTNDSQNDGNLAFRILHSDPRHPSICFCDDYFARRSINVLQSVSACQDRLSFRITFFVTDRSPRRAA
jgi:hypothetical protein